MNAKKSAKRIAIGFVLFLAGIGVLFGLLLGFAQTPFGKRQIVGFMSSSLEKEGRVRLKFGELQGFFPFHFRLDRLQVSDGDGPWMVAEEIVMHWSPLPLLSGRLCIRELQAERLGIDRIPETDTREREPAKELPKWPAALKRLRLERFVVKRLELGKSIAGERALYQLEGSLSASGSEAENETSIGLRRIDRVGEDVLVSASLRRGILALDLELDQATGGLLAHILGLQKGFSLNLHGEGPLKDWKGTLGFASEELGRCDALLGLTYGEAPGLTVGGILHLPKVFLPETWMAEWGSDVTFDFAIHRSGENTLVLDHLTLQARDLRLETSGSLDLERESTEGRFHLRGIDLKSLGGPAGIDLDGKGKVEGRFSGSILRPDMALEISLEGMKANAFGAGSLITHLDLEWLDMTGLGFQGLRVKGKGEIQGMGVEHYGPLPETRLSWEVEIEGPLNGEILVRHFKAAGRYVSAVFSGRFQTRGPGGTLNGVLEVSDLQAFKGLMGFEIPGSTRLETRIEAERENRSLSAKVQGKLASSKTTDPLLATILGGDLEFAGNLRVSETQQLEIEPFSLRAPVGRLTGNVSLDFPSQKLEGNLRLALPRLNPFATILKHPLEGDIEVEGSVKGPLKAMTLHAEARGGEVVFEGVSLQDLALNLEAVGLPSRPEGSLRFNLNHRGHRIMGETEYRIEKGSLDFSGISLKEARSELSGALVLDLEKTLVRGELHGRCRDLSFLEPMIGERLEGGGRFHTILKADDGVQGASFLLATEDIRTRFGKAGIMEIKGEVRDVFNHPHGRAEIDIHTFQLQDLSLDILTLTAEGDANQVGFRGGAQGLYKERLDLELSGDYIAIPEGFDLALNGFLMNYGDQVLQLSQPVTWHFSKKGIDFRGLELTLGSGTLWAGGKMGEGDIDLNATFEALPLEALKWVGAPDVVGTATGKAQLQGRPEQPEGSLEFQLEGIRVRDPALNDLPPMTVKGTGELKPHEFRTELFFMGLTAKPFEFRGDFPLESSLRPFSWTLSPEGRIKGQVLGEMNPGRILSLAGVDDQILEGQMDVRFILDGTVDHPELKGLVHVEKGRYENVRSGTLLKDIEIEITAVTPRLLIKRAQASDGEKGEISAQGWLDVLPDQGFPFKAEISMDQATLLRLDDATVTVGGKLTLSGSMEEAVLGGQLLIETGELRIPERLPPEIAEVEVVEIHGDSEGKNDEEPIPERKRESKIKIDVSVNSPGRIFVRGRGLDSEWQGQLKFGGEVQAPQILGSFSIVRGNFTFLGERFDMKRGLLSFDGSSPPSPRIEALAETSTKELTARLQLSGSLDSPKLELTSEPALPSDEILSRLLFGRRVSNMSPLQALQLAQAASLLAGGGGVDFMGKTRQFLGVDQLEVKQNGETGGGTSLRAGKYLREDIYLEVERGVGAETGKASVEWEVTPHITLESEVGENAEGGVGVQWKWDY